MEHLFKVIGLYTVDIDRNKTILWTIYSLILGVTFFLISLRSFEEERSKVVPKDVTSFVGTCQDLLMVFSECIWIFAAIVHQNILHNVIKTAKSINLGLLDLNLGHFNKKVYWIEALIILILIVLRSFLYVDISPYSGVWLSVSTLLADILIAVGTIQFCNFMILLQQKFKYVNVEIQKLFDTEERSILLRKLKILSQSHAQISDLFSDLSKAFGLQILSLITNAFLRTLLTTFLDVKLLLGVHYYPIETLIVLTVWTSVILLDLMAVLYFCTSTKNEGVLSGHLIHKLISKKQLEFLNEKIFMFSLQIMHRVLDFSVCGMFSLDFSVIYNLAGVATTYIVIMVQFDQAKQLILQTNMTVSNFAGNSTS